MPKAERADGAGKLLTLEAGRFLAAAGVMLFHYTSIVADFRGVRVFGDIFRPGHVGVPYFFVLSGFIMYHVHRRDIGRPDRLPAFVLRRAIRLYPMFWAISLVMLAAFLLRPALAGGRPVTPGGVLADLLLLPHGDAILAISWTLRHEMVFYALLALAIWWGSRAFWLLAGWIVLSFGLSLVWPIGKDALGGWSVIAGAINLGFGLGIGVARLAARPRPVAPASACIAAGGGGLALLGVLEWRLGAGVGHDVAVLGVTGEVAYMLCAAVLIYGLVGWERTHRMPAPRLWKMLGGASYTLYLVHQPFASLALRLLARAPGLSPGLVFCALAAGAIAVALLLHLTVERWTLARLNGLLRRWEARHAIPAAGAAAT